MLILSLEVSDGSNDKALATALEVIIEHIRKRSDNEIVQLTISLLAFRFYRYGEGARG